MLIIKNPRWRAVLRVAIPALFIPAAAVLGTAIDHGKRHLIISLLVACLSLLLFIAGIEKKTVGTRRTVIVSVMIALTVAGRMIPIVKPVTAITVITAVYLGGEAGFLVGAMSALISNFYFGQGPWTPFQMLAFGLIGLLAGGLAKPLSRHRWAICLYGVVSGVLYSAVMDVWNVLWYNGTFSPALFFAAAVTALPHTVTYALSNLLFLWLMAKPFGEKLTRVKVKYGV